MDDRRTIRREDEADKAMWKGQTTSTGFPHLCPFSPNGMDQEGCVEWSGGNAERNKNGCCGTRRGTMTFAPCNSKARRCIVCVEVLGRRGLKANAVTDVEKGTCLEHSGAAGAQPAQRRLPADPATPSSDDRREKLRQRYVNEGGDVRPISAAAAQGVRGVRGQSSFVSPPPRGNNQPPVNLGPLMGQRVEKTDPKSNAGSSGQLMRGGMIVDAPQPAAPLEPSQQPNHPVPANDMTGSGVRIIDSDDDDDESFPQQAAWEAMIARIKRAIANAVRVKVSPDEIQRMEGQPREVFDEAELAGLEASIREVGQMQDGFIRSVLLSSTAKYELLDGERRLICVRRAGIPLYNALLVEIDDEAAPYVVASILNFNRANHTDMEVSNAVKRLREGKFKVPFRIIAKMYGYKIQWTRQLYSLQKLDPRVKDLLDPRLTKDLLPVTGAIKLVRLDKYPEDQFQLAVRLHNKHLPLTSLQMEVDRILAEKNEPVRTYANEPARRLRYIERRVQLTGRQMNDVEVRLAQMAKDGLLDPRPTSADVYVAGLNDIVDAALHCIEMLGGKRRVELDKG